MTSSGIFIPDLWESEHDINLDAYAKKTDLLDYAKSSQLLAKVDKNQAVVENDLDLSNNKIRNVQALVNDSIITIDTDLSMNKHDIHNVRSINGSTGSEVQILADVNMAGGAIKT